MSAFDRIAKNANLKRQRAIPNRILTPTEDFSDFSERSDVPNVFLDKQQEVSDRQGYLEEDIAVRPAPIVNDPKSKAKKKSFQSGSRRKKNNQSSELRVQGRQQLDDLSRYEERPTLQEKSNNEIELVDDEYVPQGNQGEDGEQEDNRNKKVSILGSMRHFLGQLTFSKGYPHRRTVYINNNNEDENEINRRDLRKRRAKQTQQTHDQEDQFFSENELGLKPGLILFKALLLTLWAHPEIYLYTCVIVASFVLEATKFQGNAQYTGEPSLLLILLLIGVVANFFLQFFIFKRRREFRQNRTRYRVYFHDGRSAEWNPLESIHIKTGHVYKVGPGEFFPTDAILLHARKSLIKVNESRVLNRLSQSVSESSLRETVIKSDTVVLPISGFTEYTLSTAEPRQNWVSGKLHLEEPIQIQHNISYQNVVLRGASNESEVEVLCMALEVGVESIILKNAQYPYTFKDNDELFEKANFDKGSKRFTVQKLIDRFVIISCVAYVVLCTLGVLTGFLTGFVAREHYYLGEEVQITKVIFYHCVGLVILLPIWLKFAVLCFTLLMGKIVESNVSKRKFEIASKNSPDSLQEGHSPRVENIQTEKARKQFTTRRETIGKVKIKDYSVLPYLNHDFGLITTIDMLSSQASGLKLKKIKVKDIRFEIGKNTIESEIFSEEHKQLLKYIMSVSILTLSKTLKKSSVDFSVSQDENVYTRYEREILKAAKDQFELKLNTQEEKAEAAERHFTVSGPIESIFTGGVLRVKPIFHIPHTLEVPYTVYFYEIPVEKPAEKMVRDITDEDGNQFDQEAEERREKEPQTQKRILCLIRGDPETILMKAYGKKINLLTEADKMYQQEGCKVQFVGKFTLFERDVLSLKEEFESSTGQSHNFYSYLEKFFTQIEPMGLLAFENEFKQQAFTKEPSNPLLNRNHSDELKHLSEAQSHSQKSNSPIFSSFNDLPLMVVLAPKPEAGCLHSELESIQSITNMMTNPYLFNIPIKKVGDKILHEPIAPYEMLEKLKKEKVLCWNGWKEADVRFMLESFKEWDLPMVSYLQRDELSYLTKVCHYSFGLNTSSCGYDVGKYTDIEILQRDQTPKTLGFLSVMQILNYDSQMVFEGVYHLVLIYILKFVCYMVIQSINIGFTLGTGVAATRYPLYLVTEIVVFMDAFYYLNIGDRNVIVKGKPCTTRNMVLEAIKTALVMLVGSLLVIYSSVSPYHRDGTASPSSFTVLYLHFLATMTLILSKLSWTQDLSLFRVLVLGAQLLIYYVGMLMVSLSSLYEFNGVIFYLFNNKLYFVCIVLLWVLLVLDYGKLVLLFDLTHNPAAHTVSGHKYHNIASKRLQNKENVLDVIEFD